MLATVLKQYPTLLNSMLLWICRRQVRRGHGAGGDRARGMVSFVLSHVPLLHLWYLCAAGAKFDAVTALEVIEHVDNQPAFCGSLAALAADWGAVLVSTLSRTPQVI
jgi:hypothetical protein